MLNWRLSVLPLTLLLGACTCPMHRDTSASPAPPPAAASADAPKTAPSEASYTCPMHPQIVRNAPGKCPICGMNLVLKK